MLDKDIHTVSVHATLLRSLNLRFSHFHLLVLFPDLPSSSFFYFPVILLSLSASISISSNL